MNQSPGATAAASRTKVVLPMLTLVPGGMGGSETYARALIRELSKEPDLDVVALVPAMAEGLFDGVREVVLPQLRSAGSTADRLRTVLRTSSPWFAGRRELVGAAVVHFPLTVPVPLRRQGIPMVQTLHDVQHHDLPDLFSRPERAYRVVTYDLPARRADTVITVSEFCKERIVAQLGLDPDRIVVAPLGVDHDAHSPYDGRRQSFVLYPAGAWRHKNHGRLIAAMALLREQGSDLRLVLTGGRGDDLGQLPEWAEHRGMVPDVELRELYRSASCLAFPSLYEGFGLPPLEAMASGCPVAAADSGSLPEVCGDAAVMFDPRAVPAIAAAIRQAISSRDRLVPLGLRRVARFSWQACAEAHVEVYRRLANR
ncbi:MAG TPA: glycosyltransferase family 1 protein [Nocardioides sp.]|uniref:glycosyltransferase family 4 protein n=1 Tax=Nocardioides sp. TaxID=35761 RepID=UPI002F3FBB73